MEHHVKALMILLTSLTLTMKCSTLISMSETGSEDGHERFDVSGSSDVERLFRLMSSSYRRSLFVEIRNNMAGSSAAIVSDCYAYSNSGQLLSSLGSGQIEPTQLTIYWMNLVMFVPSIGTVDCNVTAATGDSRTLTMYDDNNMELSYLNIQWSIDERGFSLYNSVSDNFDLYQTW